MAAPAVPPVGRAGVDPRLVMGGGALLLALVLGGAWWFLGKKVPEQVPAEPAGVAVSPATEPASPVSPEPPAPVPVPVQEPEKKIVQEPAKTTPKPEAVKPRPRAEEKPKKEEKPPVRETSVPDQNGAPTWLQKMRRDLENCQGGFFCREKVRWKYCDGRWNTVPECKVND
ncbi:hypothetical protein [Azovibrio restrictus]|uniref:hypothetical protein n=1 Tax=Azovibrio restrictus TaxID=146938 RepID=UPI0026EA5B0F|nr:hypothetical protein [Azovibrio restrictus]